MRKSLPMVNRRLGSIPSGIRPLGINPLGIHPLIRHTQQRSISWFPIIKSKPISNPLIIEEPEDSNDPEINDIKHLLRSQDIPIDTRKTELITKLVSMIETSEFSLNSIPLIDEMFCQLYKLYGYNLDYLETRHITKLISKSSKVLLDSEQTKIPEHLSISILHVLKSDIIIWDRTLVRITLLLARAENSNLADALTMVSKRLSPSFITTLITTLKAEKTMTLKVYELITRIASTNKIRLDQKFYYLFIGHIRQLVFKSPLQVHEYKDFDKNLFRIQFAVNNVIQVLNMETLPLETNLNAMKLLGDLNLVNYSQESLTLLDKFISYLSTLDPESLTSTLMRQDDEYFVLRILMITAKSPLAKIICESITKNHLFYTKETILQSKLFLGDLSVKELIEESEDIDLETLYIRISELYSYTDKITTPEMDMITKEFNKKGMETPLLGYKLQLDKLIAEKDLDSALKLFNKSADEYVQWNEGNQPMVLKTLNDLIVLGCENINDIQQVFKLFTEIKQQMVNSNANIHSIIAMGKRMLDNEYVGDLIEMLNRELPPINKDDLVKLPVDQPFAYAYKNLFNLLQEFVVTFTNESTYETNWVLYGELHKYFNVPFETYLPTMRFFTEHNRLNASLIIFRQVKRLNELHGNHNYLPPSRDMYLYLFQEFGDRLYEEGVEEIHEYLKMDLHLPKQDIDVQNALLNAYSNLQDIGKTGDLFSAMLPSRHLTINEKTVQIMLKTYTYSDINHVKSFWNNMSTFGILPNYDIFRQYLIAHVYHGLPKEAIELTSEMDDYGLEFTKDTLVSMFNFCLSSKYQIVIETWAKTHHELLWNQAESENLLKRCNDYKPDNLLVEAKQELISQ